MKGLSVLSVFFFLPPSLGFNNVFISFNCTDALCVDGVPLTNVAQLSINDEKSVAVKTKESGSYSMDVTKSEEKGYSPSTER